MIEDRVKYARRIVYDIESLTREQTRRLYGHKKVIPFIHEYMRCKCILDFSYFVQFGVYHDAMRHYHWPLHGPDGLCGFLQKWYRNVHGWREPVNFKFIIWAREHCKTQILVAWDVWNFVRDPNARGLIRAFNGDKASEICLAVRELIESPAMARNFPWVRPRKKQGTNTNVAWSRNQLLLDRGDRGVRVMSLEAAGIGNDPTGGHFNFGHYDDFEVISNANSAPERKTMFEKFLNDSNLFMANSHRVFAGTPWSRDALVYSVMKKQGIFADHPYDLSVQPCTVKSIKAAITGHEPILLEDRQTLRDINADYPDDLKLHQVRVRFFNERIGDTCEEIREIEENSSTHLRVNRPFPVILGQPLSYVVGDCKPACPTRFTLDAHDWVPPDTSDAIPRKSLVQMRRDQGPLVFSSQMDLDPIDPEGMVLNPEMLRIISPDEIPQGTRRWYRATDFATDDPTAASTAITTAFAHERGLFITHIVKENQMSSLDKILELLSGSKRVESHGGHLEWTSFEKAAIEKTLGTFLLEAERDPYQFFATRPKYQRHADQLFANCGPIYLNKKVLQRVAMGSKNMRIASQSPAWMAGNVYIVIGPGWVTEAAKEQLFNEARGFRMDRQEPFDLLDNFADLVNYAIPPREIKQTFSGQNLYDQFNRRAIMRNKMARGGTAVMGWGRG